MAAFTSKYSEFHTFTSMKLNRRRHWVNNQFAEYNSHLSIRLLSWSYFLFIKIRSIQFESRHFWFRSGISSLCFVYFHYLCYQSMVPKMPEFYQIRKTNHWKIREKFRFKHLSIQRFFHRKFRKMKLPILLNILKNPWNSSFSILAIFSNIYFQKKSKKKSWKERI